tara:strand:+ start:169 stop:864 length:696 start_codon:yes stop_codon:yes gene_type:complete
MSIIIKNISKTYKNQVALNSINLNIKKGEIVGLLGPNGAGKSTLIKILTGYISANSGEVKICGDNINENPKLVKQKIGYLAENNPLYIEMYIKEYLKYIAEIYKVSFQEIDKIIELTGLNSEKNKKINQLSKGYKQRVGLAAALIHNPEVLILDEPTTGLDPNQLIEIRKLIKNIGNNKTVIFSTHILQEVEKICDRIIIINKGNIVEDQKADDLNKNKVNIETHFQKLTS